MELRPVVLVAGVWVHEDGSSSDWDVHGGTCGFLYETTYAVGLACFPAQTVTDVFVVTDSAWALGPYTHYIDNIRYDGFLVTSPRGCRRADGDNDFEDKDGHKHHGQFHGDSCGGGSSRVRDDDDRGQHFESTSVASSTFTENATTASMTMNGSGLDNGLPVGFTLVVIDNGDLLPALYSLTLTNGRTVTGQFIPGVMGAD